MKSFFIWLLSPPRALRQAQDEIEWLRSENRRLNDLLTQAWEKSRIVPVQSQHLQPPAQESEPVKTLGQMQREYAEQRVAAYEEWQREEQARLERLRETGGASVN